MTDFDKKRTYCYLGGNISQDDRTYQWREEFEDEVFEEKRIVVVNPCANGFNQKIRNTSNDDIDGMEFLKEAVKLSQDLLMPKDYKMLSICNVAVVNLEIYNTEKPMIGTLMELDWCNIIFHIPVVAICGTNEQQKSNPYVLHPWIRRCINAKVRTVKQAADMVKMFFLDY